MAIFPTFLIGGVAVISLIVGVLAIILGRR